MNLVIVGGVAAGATAAAHARRVNESAAITILERGPYISYANCGLPYFISGDIPERSDLLLQTPESFKRRFDVDVFVETEVVEIDRAGHRIRVRDRAGERWLPYDKLILAQGAQPIMPPLSGVDLPFVFKLWTVTDMDRLASFIDQSCPRHAVIVGGGYIGIEMAEALVKRGLETTIVEKLSRVMAIMDPEFSFLIARELRAQGVRILTGSGLRAISPDPRGVDLEDGRHLDADLVLVSVGVRPELDLARNAGLAIGASGGLAVDEYLATSDPDIFAAGDLIEVTELVSGKSVRIPLAGPANRQGRLAAGNALGQRRPYHGALGTSVVKIFEATAGMTGLSARSAREAGFDVGVATVHGEDHAGYYPGAQELTLSLIYDRRSGRLLGGQAFGRAGVDKRIDVLVTALHAGLKLDDLAELDLAYAPPYSEANDPINVAAFVGQNDIAAYSPLVDPASLGERLTHRDGAVVLDVRTDEEFARGHLQGAIHVNLDELRGHMADLPRSAPVYAYCRSGHRSHVAVRLLRQEGFDARNISGGAESLQAVAALPWVDE